MKKLIFLGSLILFLSSIDSFAQSYKTALGVRVGSENGISVKHFLNETNALEGQLTSRWRGWSLHGLYELNGNAFEVANLNWFFGGGAHVGFYDRYNGNPWFDDFDNETVFGLDLIIGLEYTFDEIPLNLGIDWKPEINLVGYEGFWGDEVGLSIRFAFR